MKLRKLTLQGYKTFATKTEFVFDSGITAVVGPNGSGKSNIADALRWVLGEQSYSTLRAKRSADMIFAGGPQRARAGMAQATITLDNSDGWLPIDYSEVEIARRSFRSGENEYLINGQQVRLKDVADLLATSGLAERTYAIIGQGLVDQALSLRSDERRALFEEAAGITHYKARRAETLRRLEETQRNLQRVYDILEELRPRVASLKRQATRTRNYQQISVDLRELLRVWYGYKWEQVKRELRLARQKAGTAEAAWEESRRQLLDLQERNEATQRRMATTRQHISEHQSTHDRLRGEVERKRREQAVLSERQTSLETQIAAATNEEVLLAQQQEKAQAELAAAMTELAAAQDDFQTQQTQMEQFQAATQSQESEITERQSTVARLEAERQRARTAHAQAEGRLSQLRERLAELISTAESLERQNDAPDKSDRSIPELEANVTVAQEHVAQLQSERAARHQSLQAATFELKSLRHATRDEEKELNRMRNEMARLEERVSILERSYRQEIKLEPDRLVGQLARLIRLPGEYETAIAAALGERLAAWIVQDEGALWQAVDAANVRHGGQEARLLLVALAGEIPATSNGKALLTVRPDVAGEQGVIGWANELIAVDESLVALIDRLLGTVLLVEEPATAYRLAATWPPGYQAVTRDGLLVHGGGLVEIQAASGRGGILAREARWREESDRLAEMRLALVSREEKIVTRQKEIEALQEQVDTHSGEGRRREQSESEARQRLSIAQQELNLAHQQRESRIRQQAEQDQTRIHIETRLSQTETEIAEQVGQLTQIDEALAKARQQLAALPAGEVEQQSSNLRQAQNAAQTILAGRQAVVDSRRSTLNQIDSQLNRLRQRSALLREQLGELTLDDAAGPEEAEQQLHAVESAILPLVTEIEADRLQLDASQQEMSALQKHALDLETHFTQARIRLTQSESQVENLQERIRTDLGLVSLSFDAEQTGATPLPIHEVVEQLPTVSQLPVDIEENIHLYRGQLQRIGPINPDAPAELDATEERFEFLSRQVEDLTQTDGQLRQVIGELDELTSKAFSRTVDEVNLLFDKTFKQLFGGGSGRLSMTDPDDPTSSGVEIVAQLPNRREQGLALLSGGERSLTAAALIFSLLKVAPPPFCVLDEVDAALDEANVTRFRDLLTDMSRDTQFILITHNRGTVQAAQTLYGVSMQPDSSSQVISIRPEEYLKR
jgi:chromosome segregation protein